MSSDSPNTTKKLVSSFSSPEFPDQSTIIPTDSSISSSIDVVASNVNTSSVTQSATTSSLSTEIVTSKNKYAKTSAQGIKLNETRDSGFSDSIIEDASSSLSTKASSSFVTSTEHGIQITNPTELNSNTTDIALLTKCYTNKGILKSVEEDISVIPPSNKLVEINTAQSTEENVKDYITIVKTTKVTTKVKHVNASNGNKKNKKKTGSKNKSTTNEASKKEISSTKNMTDDITIKTTTTIASQETTATTFLISNNSNINNLEIEESKLEEPISDNEHYQDTNAVVSDKTNLELFKVNINKSTEELVYEAPIKQEIAITSSETTTHPQNLDHVDLNSTVLDSEDILSTYSNNVLVSNQQNNLNINAPNLTGNNLVVVNTNSPRISDIIIVEVEKNLEKSSALNDVTQSLLNHQAINEESTIAKSSTLQIEEPNVTPESMTINLKDEEKKTNNENKKLKKNRFNIPFFKSSSKAITKSDSKKNKNSSSDTTAVPTIESPSKKPKIESQQAASTDVNEEKYILIDSEQKDRIIYLKPQCADLILKELIKFEKNENSKNKTQLSHLNDNNFRLKIVLNKMILRSLDLLRHDRIESFEKLTAQLKNEYNVLTVNLNENISNKEKQNLKKVYLSNVETKTCDLVFENLLKKYLINDKLLLKLKLDKNKLKPYEEVIKFEPAGETKIKIYDETDFNVNDINFKEEEKLIEQQNEEIDIDDTNNDVTLNEAVEIDEENQEKAEIEISNSNFNNNNESTCQDQKQSQTNSNCGTTPPPTPQNELTSNLNGDKQAINNQQKKSSTEENDTNDTEKDENLLNKVNELLEHQKDEIAILGANLLDGARIILNTVKEPPIIFPSDDANFHSNISNSIKPETKVDPLEKNQILDTNPNTPLSIKNQDKITNKKTKNKKSAFSCLSCAGGQVLGNSNSGNIDELDISVNKKLKKGKRAPSTKTTEQLVQAKEIISVTPINPDLFKNLDEKSTKTEQKTNDKIENNQETEKKVPKELREHEKNEILNLEHLDEQGKKKIDNEEYPVTQLYNNDKQQQETLKNEVSLEIQETIAKTEHKNQENLLKTVEEIITVVAPATEKKTDKKDKKKKKNSKKNKSIDRQESNDMFVNPSVDVSIIDIQQVNQIQEQESKKKDSADDIEIKIEKPDKEIEEERIKLQKNKEDHTTESNVSKIETVQIETKSVKNLETNELIEISKTIINKTESTTIVDPNLKEKSIFTSNQPSELSINTEIKITLSSSILDGGDPTQIIEENKPDKNADFKLGNVEINKEEVGINLPIIHQHEVKLENEKQNKKKKIKKEKAAIKDDEDSMVSCFMCKSKKLSTNIEKNQNFKKTEEDNPKKEVKQAKIHQKQLDSSFFIGLDPVVSQTNNETKLFDFPNVCSVEINTENKQLDEVKDDPNIEKDHLKTADYIIQIQSVTPEATVQANENLNEVEIINFPNVEINVPDLLEEHTIIKNDNLDQNLEIKEVNIVNNQAVVLTVPIKSSESQKLSDDIVVLPNPNERIETKPLTPAHLSTQIPETTNFKKDKSIKKRNKNFCFSIKKSKNKENIDRSMSSLTKNNETKDLVSKTQKGVIEIQQNVNHNDPVLDLEQDKMSFKEANPKFENWSIGLDRKENDPIIIKDPEVILTEQEKLVSLNVEKEKKLEEKNMKMESDTIEKEEVVMFENKNENIEEKIEKKSPDSKDFLAGSFIKLPHQPDHAIIPDLTLNRTKPTITLQQELIEHETSNKLNDEKKPKNKASIIDLPLINILKPHDKKNKNLKTIKIKQTVEMPDLQFPTDSKITEKVASVINDLDSIKVDNPHAEFTETENFNEKPTEQESASAQPTKLENLNSVEQQANELIEDSFETLTSSNLVSEVITQAQNELKKEDNNNIMIVESVEITTTTTTNIENKILVNDETDLTVESSKIKDAHEAPKYLDSSNVIIKKLYDSPDIIVLPELDLSNRLKDETIKEEMKKVESNLNKQTDTRKLINKQNSTTLIDLPLIDILLPQGAKIKKEKLQNKETFSKNEVHEIRQKDDEQFTDISKNIKIETEKQEQSEIFEKKNYTIIQSHAVPSEIKGKQAKASKQPNPIDKPLVVILQPIKSKNKDSSVFSCFSCKSKKMKKEIQHLEQRSDNIKNEEEIYSKEQIPNVVIDLNIGNIKLDAPYKEILTSDAQVKQQHDIENRPIDAEELKQKLEIVLETESLEKIYDQENKNHKEQEEPFEEIKRALLPENQLKLTNETADEIKPCSDPLILAEDQILNDYVVVEVGNEKNGPSNLVEVTSSYETSSSNTTTEHQKVKKDSLLNKDNLDMENNGKKDEIKSKEDSAVIKVKNTEKIELNKSKELIQTEFDKTETMETKLNEIKEKNKKNKQSKKEKDDDVDVDFISCFSCKSKKAKKTKKDLQSINADKRELKSDNENTQQIQYSGSEESNQAKVGVEVNAIDLNLFKGLDRPISSISDGDHIVNNQSFLDINSNKENVEIINFKENRNSVTESKFEATAEKSNIEYNSQLSSTFEKSQNREIIEEKSNIQTTNFSSVENVSKNEVTAITCTSVAITECVQIQELNDAKGEELYDKKEEANIKSSQENENKFVKSETELELTLVPDANSENVKNKVDLVLLQTKETTAPDPISLNLNIIEENFALKEIDTPKVKLSKKSSNTFSCFSCRSKESKKSLKKPVIEQSLPVKTLDTSITQNLSATTTPPQPPKKPPRGHLDESYINIESNVDSNNIFIENIEMTKIPEDVQITISPAVNKIELNKDAEAVEDTHAKEVAILIDEIKEIVAVNIEKQKEKKEKEDVKNEFIDIKENPIEEIENTSNEEKFKRSNDQTMSKSKTEKIKKKKPKKEKKGGFTSIIDLPLIEILTPKKIDKKEKNKEQKVIPINVNIETAQSEHSAGIKLETDKQITEIKTTGHVNALNIQNYFKDLDPPRSFIPREIKEETIQIDINKSEEITIDESIIRDEIKQERKKSIQTQENKESNEIEIPTFVDVKFDYVYTPPSKIETWSTDPLPSVIIGLHKVDFSELKASSIRSIQKKEVEEIQNKEDSKLETKSSVTQAEKDTVLSSKIEKKEKLNESKSKTLQLLNPPEHVEFPSSYIAEIIDASNKIINNDSKKEINVEILTEKNILKEFSSNDKKLLKTNKKQISEYLKSKIGCTKHQLIEEQMIVDNKASALKLTKESREKEKLAHNLIDKSIKIILKKRTKNKPITYDYLNSKLENEIKKKTSTTDSLKTKFLIQIRKEIEDGTLLSNSTITGKLIEDSNKQQVNSENQINMSNQIKIDFTNLDSKSNNGELKLKEPSASSEKLNDSTEPGVMKRFPSLTWREANERARILFYKGRVPSIHYNEKRDSFRVSMITQVNTADGKEKTTEVPVCDDDVRRLLNSCGLYWNGESISLLNKSDEIFLKAQQEAFQILQTINNNTCLNDSFSFNFNKHTSTSTSKTNEIKNTTSS